MSLAQSSAVAEYFRIKRLFSEAKTDADFASANNAWQAYLTADNGWSIASDIIMHPSNYNI